MSGTLHGTSAGTIGGETAAIHHLYQDLFITDLKKEVDMQNTEQQQIRWQLQERTKENEDLKSQVKKLNSVIESYRRMLTGAIDTQKGVSSSKVTTPNAKVLYDRMTPNEQNERSTP
jgi:hypothetical protein